jgi:hypothetical protein
MLDAHHVLIVVRETEARAMADAIIDRSLPFGQASLHRPLPLC